MKKHLIVFVAMAVAVSSCTEKIPSEDNQPEKTKLLRKCTLTDAEGYTLSQTFTYDQNNRVAVSILSYGEQASTTWSYSDDNVLGKNGSNTTLYTFQGDRLLSCGQNCQYYYDNQSSKPTGCTLGNSSYQYVWTNGDVTKRQDGNDYVIYCTYTDKVNKCNLQVDHTETSLFYMDFIDRNVFGCLANKHLISTRTYTYPGGESVVTETWLHQLDADGYPVEMNCVVSHGDSSDRVFTISLEYYE